MAILINVFSHGYQQTCSKTILPISINNVPTIIVVIELANHHLSLTSVFMGSNPKVHNSLWKMTWHYSGSPQQAIKYIGFLINLHIAGYCYKYHLVDVHNRFTYVDFEEIIWSLTHRCVVYLLNFDTIL